MIQQRQRRAASLLLAALGLAGLAWLGGGDAPSPGSAPAQAGVPEWAAGTRPYLTPISTLKSDPGALVDRAATGPIEALLERWASSSHRGSTPDGALRFDDTGRLHADAGLRARFDYALTLLGEFTLSEIRQLLAHWIAGAQGEDAADQALALFDRYLALKQAEAEAIGSHDPAHRLSWLAALRRQHFGDAAEAMFGDEEDYLRYTLQRLAVLGDSQLGAAQQGVELAALHAGRDPAQREAEALAQMPALLAEHAAQLNDLGADATRRFSEREALFGAAAAQRLAELDAAEADWARRLQAARGAWARLLGDPRLDEAARQRALGALLAAQFSAPEQRRVRALLGLPNGGG